MLDSTYHMKLKLKCQDIDIFRQCYNGHHYVVYPFYCMALYHSQARGHVINVV